MSVIKYVGRKTDFRGKTLWEIVGNLKNFGVGRYVVRSMFERYEEKSFMKILKVEAMPNEETRKVKVTVEKTFRGHKYPKPCVVFSTSYKADYRLLSKAEENDYCNITKKSTEQILDKEIDLPPLLSEFIESELNIKYPKIKLKMNLSRDKFCRIANDNETPTIKTAISLDTSINPQLYKDCV